METESILFQPLSDEESAPAVRKAFRVPIPEASAIALSVGGRWCRVVNISRGGVSIVSDTDLGFDCTETAIPCELKLDKNRLPGLRIKIIHCAAETSGEMTYGAQWLDLSKSASVAINDAIARMKAALLENCDRADKV